jgi:hypothetical protein
MSKFYMMIGVPGSGKSIPPNIVMAMSSSFEQPSSDEGFDRIIHVNN